MVLKSILKAVDQVSGGDFDLILESKVWGLGILGNERAVKILIWVMI
jgi:hypothetical protein